MPIGKGRLRLAYPRWEVILESFDMAVRLHGVQANQYAPRAEAQEVARQRPAMYARRRRLATQAAALQRAHDARPRLRDGSTSRFEACASSLPPLAAGFSGVWAVAVCSATLPEITPPSSIIIAP